MRTKIVSQTKKYNSSSTQIIISLDIFQNRIIFPMHTLRFVLQLFEVSSVSGLLLRRNWTYEKYGQTDRQGDTHQNFVFCGIIKLYRVIKP